MPNKVRERKPMSQEEEQLLEAAMSRFKWHRVFVAMDATDWQWSSVGGVPELVDLKRCVRELAYTIICKRGHAMLGNTYIRPNGERSCMECARIVKRNGRARLAKQKL